MESAIRASRGVAVLVGADGLGPWENVEQQAMLQLAVRDNRPVIPVLLPDAPVHAGALSHIAHQDLKVRSMAIQLARIKRVDGLLVQASDLTITISKMSNIEE